MWTRTWIQLLQGVSWPSAGPQHQLPARPGEGQAGLDIPSLRGPVLIPSPRADPLSWWMATGRQNRGWLMDKSNPFQWFSGIFWEENSRKRWAFCWFDRSGLGLCDLGMWEYSRLILEIQIDDGRVLGYWLNLHHPYTLGEGEAELEILHQCSQWGLANPPCLILTHSTWCPSSPSPLYFLNRTPALIFS